MLGIFPNVEQLKDVKKTSNNFNTVKCMKDICQKTHTRKLQIETENLEEDRKWRLMWIMPQVSMEQAVTVVMETPV